MNGIFDNLYIFEMANNHQGDVEHGLKIIDAMSDITRRRKIRAGVKFQYRDLKTFIHPEFRDRSDVKHIPRFLSTRLTDKAFRTMAGAVKDAGMIPIATPFDEASVNKCLERGIEIIKIASCSATDWPLLEAVAAAGRPVIVSTGGLDIYAIDNIVSFFTHHHANFALMHCVAVYPVNNDQLNMNFMDKLQRRYPDVPVGYSGHEAPDNLDIVNTAVGKGAKILERHVGLPTDKITLNRYSMNPDQVDVWIAHAERAKVICGSETKAAISEETGSLLSLQRGVFAARDIKKGSVIGRKDVFFAMPCQAGQTTSGTFGRKHATTTASRNYRKNEAISEEPALALLNSVRECIHDAKGMILEAGIVLGGDVEIELSHQYGLPEFARTGALIVNVINREYCKKIIALLPDQSHPNHYHKEKEETFHLLSGEMEVVINGHCTAMKQGEKILVERGAWHSFSSKSGAVFEEVSTTHIRNDSYYEDRTIAVLDPMERKTILESW